MAVPPKGKMAQSILTEEQSRRNDLLAAFQDCMARSGFLIASPSTGGELPGGCKFRKGRSMAFLPGQA